MMVTRARIIIADDHKLITDCLVQLLEPNFDVVGVAENGRELLEKAQSLQPDIAVVDISMPILNGVEAARRLREISPSTRIIFLTMHTDRPYVDEAFRAGGSAFVLKRAAAAELVMAIHTVIAGGQYLSPSVEPPAQMTSLRKTDALTTRQREILQLVAEGNSAKQIAALLAISRKTVEFHKAALMTKVGVRSTAQLTRFAIEQGIVSA